ncbi:5-azacytidine-induced protein [Echinococcus granulosus]|uniref:5-azacytidine-induced protein n=1 Tax=Echinococcus granulosus TaxID=6210 RepID=W6UWP7_ECHGR|nr:5-azacytidine-induced protein [Echinococcus granulosus]EUB62917.1 5-azacytidine-induced protein [Echinococcus granulosus]
MQRNKKGKEALTIAVERSVTPRTIMDQLNESLKTLSDVESVAKARYSHLNAGSLDLKGDGYVGTPILTPRQMCILRQEDGNCGVPEDKVVAITDCEGEALAIGEETFDLNESLDTPTCSDVASKDVPIPGRSPPVIQSTEESHRLQKQKAVEVESALRDCEKRLRDEYEVKLEKNYRLIDELIAEKKALTEQCDKLVASMRQISEKALAKQKLLEENHKVELKKVEAKAAAAEKIKRERWEAAKTKAIKELTMKGVEREIQRLMLNHKEELEEMKRLYKEDLEAADARAFESYSQKLEELRSRFSREREEICLQERKLADGDLVTPTETPRDVWANRNWVANAIARLAGFISSFQCIKFIPKNAAFNLRYDALMAEERRVWDGLRKKLLKDASEEKDRLITLMTRERTELEEKINQLNTALSEANQRSLHEVARVKKALESEYALQLEKLQSQLESDKKGVEETVRTQLKSDFQEREREIIERLRKERDRQLEAVVQRLEAEATLSREEAESSAQERIKRMKEKHQKDIDDLEAAERQANEKYNQLRARCLELEGEVNCQKVRLAQVEEEARQTRATNERLMGEREQLREVVAREVAEEIAAAGAKAGQAQRELAEVRAQASAEVARLQAELTAAKLDAADELESVHQRIKEAIVKKDENIKELVRRHEKQGTEHRRGRPSLPSREEFQERVRSGKCRTHQDAGCLLASTLIPKQQKRTIRCHYTVDDDLISDNTL